MKPHLCFFTDSLEPSGVGEHMLTLAGLHLNSYNISFVCPPTQIGMPFLERAQRMGLQTLAIEARYNTPAVEQFHTWICAQGVDIFHCHAGITWEGFGGVEAAHSVGVAAIVRTEHLPYLLTHPIQQEDHSRCVRYVDRIICVGQGALSSFIEAGVPAPKLCVVRNGIVARQRPTEPMADSMSVRKRLGLPAAARIILTVGRLTEQKGHERLLKVAPGVIRREPNAYFVWVGEGHLEANLRERVHDEGLEEHVLLLGRRDDVPELMAASDLLALPSLFEGLPLVVLEAMAAGLPVVGTRVCGISEAVLDGVTGRLVEPEDMPALAAALLEVLEQPALAARWGAAGRLRVEQEFTANRMARETAAIYEALLDAPRRPWLDTGAHTELMPIRQR